MSVASFVPKTLRLSLYAGDGASLKITATNPDGSPMDLDGAVVAQIRKLPSATAKESFAVAVTDNEVVLSLTGTQTASLASSGEFVGSWDCQWTSPGQEPLTLIHGDAVCSQDVTRGS